MKTLTMKRVTWICSIAVVNKKKGKIIHHEMFTEEFEGETKGEMKQDCIHMGTEAAYNKGLDDGEFNLSVKIEKKNIEVELELNESISFS